MTPDADVRDDDRFVFIASAIAEGTPIEWSQEEEGLSEDEAAILREMQSLESIASANAQLRLHFTDTEVTIGDRPRVAAPAPKSWRHLTILQKIAEGGFGGIYRAHDSVLATDVALKLLAPRGTTGDLNESRILREARLLAKVRHPNVVTIYGADHTHERVGLWMEFIKGRTLEHLLRAQGPFGAREAALIGLDLCRAVAAVHRAGLIHGDIKAHNVMREEGGRTVLMDFGASRDLTQTGDHDVVGTPVYLAPEVLSGKPQTKASDIYALGILLYHLLTNDYPVGGQTWSEVVASTSAATWRACAMPVPICRRSSFASWNGRPRATRTRAMRALARSKPRCRISSIRRRGLLSDHRTGNPRYCCSRVCFCWSPLAGCPVHGLSRIAYRRKQCAGDRAALIANRAGRRVVRHRRGVLSRDRCRRRAARSRQPPVAGRSLALHGANHGADARVHRQRAGAGRTVPPLSAARSACHEPAAGQSSGSVCPATCIGR